MRTHIEYPYVPLIYEWFHFGNRIPWSPTFFPAARKECRPRKGAPPRVSGLNFETPAYVRATRSLRSLKHGAAASRRRSQNFPLRGRPPTERAGSCTNTDHYHTQGAGFIFDADVSHTPVRAHIEIAAFFFMPGEVLCRVQARSLMALYVLMRERTHIR